MKRKYRFVAALLILSMGMTVFSERVLASEPETLGGQAVVSEEGEPAAEQPQRGDSEPVVAGEGTDRQEQPEAVIDEAVSEKDEESAGADITEPQGAGKDKVSEEEGKTAEKNETSEPKTQEADDKNAEAVKEDALSETDLDDPGRERLSGAKIPADFFGGGIKTRAASSKVTHNKNFPGIR